MCLHDILFTFLKLEIWLRFNLNHNFQVGMLICHLRETFHIIKSNNFHHPALPQQIHVYIYNYNGHSKKFTEVI